MNSLLDPESTPRRRQLPFIRLARAVWQRCPAAFRPFAVRAIAATLPRGRGTIADPDKPDLIVGGFREISGIGAGARRYREELIRAGRDVVAVELSAHLAKEGICRFPVHSPDAITGIERGGRIVFHVNPPTFLYALHACRRLVSGRRVVGFWAWELEHVPPSWRSSMTLVDEMECPSEFTAAALRKMTDKPVRVHPPFVAEGERELPRHAEDGVLRILIVFDYLSDIRRKNPAAAIEAFVRAFTGDARAELVVKASNPAVAPLEHARIEKMVRGHGNIKMVCETLTAAEYSELMGRSDVLLSLHRSEGYGLPLREAMASGLSVVATGWSGNMDFMAGPRCHAVPYTLVPVDEAYLRPFGMTRQRWAEPDIAAAAEILRGLAG